MIPGEVPELECREAAVYVHVPWAAWVKLSSRERAAAVAHYRTKLAIDAHINHAATKESQRKADIARRRRGSRPQ